MSLANFNISKEVHSLPETIAANTIYLVRRGLGFDMAISDSEGIGVRWLNDVSSLWNNTIMYSHSKVPHNLSITVPYMFNTRATSTTWNTGFERILDSIRNYKALKFYVILDLYNLNALNLARATEAVNILTGMGAIPLAYVSTDGAGFNDSILPIVNTLVSRYGRKVGIFLHSSVALPDFSLSSLSVAMSGQYLYPLVTYSNNLKVPSTTFFNSNHGDIHFYHVNGSSSGDALYDDTLSQYEYHMKGAFLFNTTEPNIATVLNRFNHTGSLFITNLTNSGSIMNTTIPSYYETMVDSVNRYVLNMSGTMSDLVGTIQLFAHTNIPNRVLLANGASVRRSTYPALFAKIGTRYGSANNNFFNLPDLRNRIVFGTDAVGNVGSNRDISIVTAARLANYSTVLGINMYPCIYY